jgi:hypothetical protein
MTFVTQHQPRTLLDSGKSTEDPKMHVFEMVAIIVVVSLIVGLIKHWLDVRSRDAEHRSGSVHDEQQKQIGELKERIKILETIVTDGNYELKKEFQELEG